MGMPPDLVPRVFDLFVQGPRGVDRREGGLGLGLAVARTLVMLHGGRIEASSPGEERGSTFAVRLPLARQGDAVPRSVDVAADSGDLTLCARRVLVVDDNGDACDMLAEALKHEGFEVFGAASAGEALDLAGRVAVDVAVLDIGLPDMDGYDLARALRSRGMGPIQLVAVTGYGREQDRAAAEAAGFDSFFVKPVDVPALVDALKQRL
jgi:CheY-like chemotaxis protein